MNTRIESLQLIEKACWQQLLRAVGDREHGWRLMTLATIDGDRADARSVVLRDVLPDERMLLFYCDDRSPKVQQLRAHPLGTLVLWSSTLSWQLRLHVDLKVEDHGLDISSRWARVRLGATHDEYLSAEPPGTPLDGPDSVAGARAHFAIVSAWVQQMDWLELHDGGHRRAVFDAQGARWVQP